MRFKLPNLAKLVSSDKGLEDSDPKKLIHIHDGYAFVCDKVYAVVNLREYVKRECHIVDENELEELTSFIKYLNGNSFNKEFWKEFVKENELSFEENRITLRSLDYSKTINYQNIECDYSNERINLVNFLKGDAVERNFHFAISHKDLKSLTDAFPELKSDSILMHPTSEEGVVKISAAKKDYIFGFLNTNYDDSTEFTAFMNVVEFTEEQ